MLPSLSEITMPQGVEIVALTKGGDQAVAAITIPRGTVDASAAAEGKK